MEKEEMLGILERAEWDLRILPGSSQFAKERGATEKYAMYQYMDEFLKTDEGKAFERKNRLLVALFKTLEIPAGNTNYLDSTLRQRLGGIEGADSWFENMTEDELLEKLVSTDAELTEFTPEGAFPGCTYYKINIPGKNGIVDLDELPENSPLFLSITHAGTGRLSVSTTQKVPAKDERETTIILGDEEGVGEIMFTLHPGLPVAPSDLTIEGLEEQYPELKDIIEGKSSELLAEGKDRDEVVLQITREQAKSLGFDMAKLTSDELARRLEEQQVDVRDVKREGISLGKIQNAVKEHEQSQEQSH